MSASSNQDETIVPLPEVGAGGDTAHTDEDDYSYFDKKDIKLPSDPELDNFLTNVDQIADVIKSLSSTDPGEVEKGLRKADILLQTESNKEDSIDEDGEGCRVKSSRTLINKTEPEKQGGGEGDTQGFMRFVEKDVEDRAADRKKRKTKSDEFRKKGNICFSTQDFVGALNNYNNAIELIKDSPCLYNNRALTYIRMRVYEPAIEDCNKALRLEENSLRARMFKAKAQFLLGKAEDCRETLKEAKVQLPGSAEIIHDYEGRLFNMSDNNETLGYDLDSEKKWQSAARYEGTKYPVGKGREKK